jgi:biopolymer transport protein ExbD
MDAITLGNKKEIKVDFAPMVDLGFLLITFFMFTTELLKPQTFGLHVPNDDEVKVRNQTPASSTITLQMKGNGVLDYYEGLQHKPIQKGTLTLYKQNSLRNHLIDKRNRILQQLQTDSNYTVLIQPNAETSYKEMIDVMDEMKILDIRKYVLVDVKQ